MPSIAQIVAAGREMIARDPLLTDDELRARLHRQFLVERDEEVVLLRSGLWPLAALARWFRGSPERRAARVRERVDEAMQRLRPRW